MKPVSKKDRLKEIFKGLERLPLAASFDEAFTVLEATINEVEDESSGVPSNPATWQ